MLYHYLTGNWDRKQESLKVYGCFHATGIKPMSGQKEAAVAIAQKTKIVF